MVKIYQAEPTLMAILELFNAVDEREVLTVIFHGMEIRYDDVQPWYNTWYNKRNGLAPDEPFSLVELFDTRSRDRVEWLAYQEEAGLISQVGIRLEDETCEVYLGPHIVASAEAHGDVNITEDGGATVFLNGLVNAQGDSLEVEVAFLPPGIIAVVGICETTGSEPTPFARTGTISQKFSLNGLSIVGSWAQVLSVGAHKGQNL